MKRLGNWLPCDIAAWAWARKEGFTRRVFEDLHQKITCVRGCWAKNRHMQLMVVVVVVVEERLLGLQTGRVNQSKTG